MKKVGISPLNSRIMVDYEKKDIKFSYPGGPGSLKTRMGIIGGMIFLPIAALFLSGFFISAVLHSMPEIIYAYNHPNHADAVEGILGFVKIFGVIAVATATTLFISYIVSTKYKYFASTFPKLQFKIYSVVSGVKEIRIKKLDSDEFILPTFSNVVLDYELKGDFADKIKYVNVIDYPYKLYYKGECHNILKMWKAIFKFKERPVNGSMVLRFI
jgi:hypothetical protein